MDKFTDEEVEQIEKDRLSEKREKKRKPYAEGSSGGLKFVSRDILNEEATEETAWIDPGDPVGNYWEYSQSTGVMTRVDGVTGKRKEIAEGYAGKGEGLNNPDMQYIEGVGPIPQGKWSIGKLRDGGKKGPHVMDLLPKSGTAVQGRHSFMIHGDSRKCDYSASEGCIVLSPMNVRKQIGNSGIPELRVVP